MNNSVTRKLAHLQTRFVDRFLDFKPFIATLPVGEPPIRFFHGTAQAADWYSPLGPHLIAEFEWVKQHIARKVENIIDAGAFHGLYSMVLANAAGPGSRVIAVDPVESNGAIMEANFALNHLSIEIVKAVISDTESTQRFTRESCGKISDSGALAVAGRTLPSIMADATIVKLDIEGAEFSVLPLQLDEMHRVHTWIVEIHPGYGSDPRTLLNLFRERPFQLFKLERHSATLIPLNKDETWNDRATLIALRH